MSVRLETSTVDASSALFVRPTQSTDEERRVSDDAAAAAAAAGTSQVAFVPLMRPAALTHVHASFGQFSSTVSVARSAVRKAVGASERHNPGVVLSEVEISAHVVAQAVLADRPVVQVLFHAALTPSSSDSTGQASAASAAGVEATFCATARLLHSDAQRRLTSAPCALTVRSVVCLVSVGLPASWWHPQRSDTVQVRRHTTKIFIYRPNKAFSVRHGFLTVGSQILDGPRKVRCYLTEMNDIVYFPDTALLEWVSEYAVQAYRSTTQDSAISYLNNAQMAYRVVVHCRLVYDARLQM